MIRISSRKEGFRRAGIAHTVAPKEYPDNAFTSAQLEQLKAEPMLRVVEIPDEPDTDLEVDSPEAMTVAQLKSDLVECGLEDGALRNLKKAELVELWTATKNGLQALGGK
jgi:hypothetical protein